MNFWDSLLAAPLAIWDIISSPVAVLVIGSLLIGAALLFGIVMGACLVDGEDIPWTMWVLLPVLLWLGVTLIIFATTNWVIDGTGPPAWGAA